LTLEHFNTNLGLYTPTTTCLYFC